MENRISSETLWFKFRTVWPEKAYSETASEKWTFLYAKYREECVLKSRTLKTDDTIELNAQKLKLPQIWGNTYEKQKLKPKQHQSYHSVSVLCEFSLVWVSVKSIYLKESYSGPQASWRQLSCAYKM